MRLLTAFLATATAILIAGCGSGPQGADRRAAVSPTPSPTAASLPTAASSPTPTSRPSAPPTPAPTSAPLPTQLTISGPLTATIHLPQSAGKCMVIPGGFEAQIPFTNAGTSYEVDIQLLDYTGPGTYRIPPEPVAVHTVGNASSPALFTMTSGTVTVSSTHESGTVDGALGGGTPGKLDGTWSCG